VPAEAPPAPLFAGLLVGGESRRFGSPKALAVWRGRSFAERVASSLAAAAPELVLLGDGPVPEPLAGLPRIADAPGLRGPLAGILGALAARPGCALLVAGCDQPLLTPAALRWLAALREPGAIAALGRAGARGLEPLPGVYEPAAAAVLAELGRAGGSLQPLAARSDVVVRPLPPALAAAWTSVDRREQRAELERGTAE
jgi:molybdopterin-guanine dinucleotide biosynthesis protein A